MAAALYLPMEIWHAFACRQVRYDEADPTRDVVTGDVLRHEYQVRDVACGLNFLHWWGVCGDGVRGCARVVKRCLQSRE